MNYCYLYDHYILLICLYFVDEHITGNINGKNNIISTRPKCFILIVNERVCFPFFILKGNVNLHTFIFNIK